MQNIYNSCIHQCIRACALQHIPPYKHQLMDCKMATTLSKEDVVRRKHRGQMQLGLVTYSYTGDSSSEDEDDDASDIVREGEARIAWYPKGREEVIAEDKVTLHDRCLLPGDIVKKNVTVETQKGLIKSIKVLCHLQVLSNKQMIYNIPSQELHPIVPFQVGDHVVMDDWVGIVRESYNNVVLRFKSDARCSVCEDNACRLTDVHDISDENSVFGEDVGFFPGQILQGPAGAFKGAKWLAGPRPILGSKTRFRVTVEEVKNTGLDVQWCSRAVTKSTTDLKPPPMCIKGKNLERTQSLNFSAHASIQIGDKCMYKVKEDDLRYPEPVTKGSILSFRKPDEKSVGSDLQAAVDSAGTDSIQSLMLEVIKVLRVKIKNLSRKDTSVDSAGSELPKDEQMAQEVSGVGCKVPEKRESEGDGEQSVPSGPGQSAVTNHTSATEERLSSQENEQGDSSRVTEQGTSHDAGFQKSISEFREYYARFMSMMGEVKSDDKSSDPGNVNIVRQVERHLNLPSPSDIARASLKPAFSLVNGEVGNRESSESQQEHLNRMGDSRQRSIFTNFEKLHDEMETLIEEFLNYQASGSLEKSSIDKIVAETGKDMQGQMQLLRGLIQSKLSSIKASKKQNAYAEAEVTPNELPEAESNEENGEKVVEDASSGDDMEWEEEEEEEEVVEDGEQSDSDDAEDVGGGEEEEEEGKSVQAKSKNPSQKTKKAKKQKQTSSQPKKRKERMVRGDPVTPGQCVCVEITHTTTMVDVLWQDGSYETDIISTDVVPCRNLDELEFFPGDFVMQSKGHSEDGYGVVTQADNKERTCAVNWVTRNLDNPTQPIMSSEEHSVYELTPHGDFVFSTDDVVVRIAHNSKEEEESADDLPPAGQVYEVNGDGSISVRWVDDTMSKVFPHQLFRVEEEFDSELSITDILNANKELNEEEDGDGSHDNTSSDSSWETASGESGEEGHEGDEVCEEEVSHAPDDSMTISKTEPPDTEAQRTGEVETADKAEEPLSTNSDCSVLQQSSTDITESKEQATVHKEETEQTMEETQKNKDEKEEVEMKLEVTKATEEEMPVREDRESIWDEDGLQSPNAASRFIVVPSLPSCHYFSSAQEPANQKQFLQTWRKEVHLLQTALPQGILVKAFEDRMDMFSVMIEGPVNTPYEDGVFFFDIRLLGDYPKTPPKVHYLSFCSGRLNPNLYSDGKVCLSLLGTWTGKGNEMWTSSSNLLQLLVSVQGLILVNEPYYNEAGYDKHRGTRESLENCRMYNEMALVKLVQSMTKMVSSPPFLFKEEALMFCRKHSVRLIRRLESWLDLASRSKDIPRPTKEIVTEASPGSACQQDQLMHSSADASSEAKSGSMEDKASSNQEESVGDKVLQTPQPQSSLSSSSSSLSSSKADSVALVPPEPETTSQTDSTTITPPSTTIIQSSSSLEDAPSYVPLISTSLPTPEHPTLEPSHNQTSSGAVIPGGGSISRPPYSLFPLSKGFIISLRHTLKEFKSALKQAGIS